MTKTAILACCGQAHEKTESMLEKMGFSVCKLDCSQDNCDRELSNTSADLLFCYTDECVEEIVDSFLIYSRDNQTPVIFIISRFTVFLEKIQSFEHAWYIKEPFDEDELSFTIEKSFHVLKKEKDIKKNEANHQRLQLALETAKLELWEWDFKQNKFIRETLGGVNTIIPSDLTIGGFETFHRFIHPDDRDRFREKIELCWEGKQIHIEFRSVPIDGKPHWYSLLFKPLLDDSGKPVKMIGISRDITQEKDAEIALRESEERFRLIAESARDVIWLLDRNAKLLYISPSVERLRGYTPEELMDTPVEKILMPDSYKELMSVFETFFKHFRKGLIPDVPRIFEVQQPCRDGSTVWTEMHITPVLDEEGEFKFFLGISRNIDERKRNEQELEKQRKLLDLIFNLAPIPIVLTDKSGIVEDINNVCMEIAGKSKDEIIGLRAGEVFSCPNAFKGNGCGTNEECKKCVFRGIEEETLRKRNGIYKKEGTISVLLPNGVQISRNILVSTSYIDSEGDPKIMFSVDDITDLRKVEQEIINSKIEAEEANRAKSEFLANMSHELRTPLNAIMGYSEILQDSHFGHLNEKQKKFAEHINTSGRHLLELINSILDISKVESGKMELHFHDFRVIDTIRNVQNVIVPLARKKDIELKFSVEPESLSLRADEIKFKQILYNLLSNAVKFTPDNGLVEVKVHERGDMAEVLITDTGIGISAEDQEKLFTPFHQIDSSISRKYQGTGLGLALVKRFVELHGGNIVVESEPGIGSTFIFTIPLVSQNTYSGNIEMELSAN